MPARLFAIIAILLLLSLLAREYSRHRRTRKAARDDVWVRAVSLTSTLFGPGQMAARKRRGATGDRPH
jgi:hypothetical protein